MISERRNIQLFQGTDKALHSKNGSFHFALIVVTICSISNPLRALFITIKWTKI